MIGDCFNPWHRACGGLRVADIVGRFLNLGAGPKRLYARLVRFAGREGICFPSQETLAAELGVSVRTVRRDLATLARWRLIQHQRGGRGRSNRYVFLWHEEFERSRMAAQRLDAEGAIPRDERPELDDPAVVDRSHSARRKVKNCQLTGHAWPPNQERKYEREGKAGVAPSRSIDTQKSRRMAATPQLMESPTQHETAEGPQQPSSPTCPCGGMEGWWVDSGHPNGWLVVLCECEARLRPEAVKALEMNFKGHLCQREDAGKAHPPGEGQILQGSRR